MGLPLLALGAAAAPAVIQGVSGLLGIGRGKRMAKRNPFVNESVNENLIKNAAIAENMARVGTPQEQYNNQLQAIQKNQAGGVRMLSRTNNPSAGVSSLVRASNEAIGGLNARDAMDRQQNQRIAMQQRGILAGEQNRVWDWNKRQRYLQQAQAAAETIGAGRQNLFGGLQGLSQLGQMALSGGQGGGSKTGGGSGLSGFMGIGNGGRYLNRQMNNSLNTGYGMNPFTPNA